METIFYAHSFPEIDKRKLSEEERKQNEEDKELNDALKIFFQYQLAKTNLRLSDAETELSLEYYRNKETRMIKEAIGVIAVFAREGKGIKRDVRKAKKYKRPYVVLYDKEAVSIEFTDEFLKKEGILSKDVIPFERKKFYLELTRLITLLDSFITYVKQREEFLKKK